ncbi:hypothetical protein NQD34_001397 [Periophthalmus magnuspinnatus]|uniref:ly-6/neurotoxin-like protein 1 n=1 Tax=Periophthalmus magnuspinnatus TaxID=409849 RepID=UPI00145A3881|nr:ly-6/neurotoxin-like protein 1 [Periophthalmus magnuspinnatus]KAJ0001601.1 hypothetical protein NQD34_001397 [Periophthalmus magnuspinnatus]
MMIKAFLLLVGLSAAYSLKCYVCVGDKDCTKTLDCGSVPMADRCFSGDKEGVYARGCIPNALCKSPLSCCEGDLCNGSAPTAPTVVLLLLSSAVFSLFL